MGETRVGLPRSFKVVAVMTTTIMAVIASSSWAVEAGRVFQSSDIVQSASSSSRLSCVGDSEAALFVFGASYMDVGENFAAMPFRSPSDFLPYGVDFFNGSATGRYSNGRLIIDHICMCSDLLTLSLETNVGICNLGETLIFWEVDTD